MKMTINCDGSTTFEGNPKEISEYLTLLQKMSDTPATTVGKIDLRSILMGLDPDEEK